MSNERLNFSTNIENLQKLEFSLLYASTSKYEGDWQSLPHSHHFTEIFYVLSGRGHFLVEDALITVRENDIVIVNPNVEHTEKSLDAKPLEYLVFGVEGLALAFGDERDPKNYYYCSYGLGKNHFYSLSKVLLKEINDKHSGYEAICHDILEILLISIARSERINILTLESARLPRECALAKRYIDSNYAGSITLDSLAEAAHINKYYLSHAFTKALGMSPISYLIQRRLEAAQDLLLETDHSIAQVASSTGFASQSYFSHLFKKLTGLSPNQFRRKNAKRPNNSSFYK